VDRQIVKAGRSLVSKDNVSRGAHVIRKATLEDLNAILELAAGIFFQQSGEWYANRSWHRFVPERFDPSEFFVADSGGSIVGVAAFRSFTLRMPGNDVPWVGVGSVCTAPECRGQGIMSGMLRAGIQDTDERGIPVSILWGDRARYGRFGWEEAGRQIELGVSRRHFGDPEWSDVELGELVGLGKDTKWPPDLGDRLGRIQQRYAGRLFRAVDEHLGLITSPRYRTVWVTQGDHEAYAVVEAGEKPRRLLEVCGDPDLLAGLLGHLMKGSSEGLSLITSTEPSPAEQMMIDNADYVKISATGKARIHDLAALLTCYEPWWAKQRRFGSGSVVLAMQDESGAELQTVALRWTPQQVTVQRLKPGERPEDAGVIAADRRGLTRLLFGPLPPKPALAHVSEVWRVAEIFPVPLYVPPLERV
jgi:predicted N-acetyltransferase YhbS